MGGWVYMMANRSYGTIYLGVSANVERRALEHRAGAVPGFTKRYGIDLLVWYEWHDHIVTAIQREHTMKHWPRRWKAALIDKMNPDWIDLYPTIS